MRAEIRHAKSAKQRAHYAAIATSVMKFCERVKEHFEDLEEEPGLYEDSF